MGALSAGALVPASLGARLRTRAAESGSSVPPDDVRRQPPKDLDGYFPFTPPASVAEWTVRAARVRRQLEVALGLWPRPTRTALNPVVHGGFERENFRVEKVYFESFPGLFVTGSLYRPLRPSGRVPGILFPHGHFKDGRFMDRGEEANRLEIARGAERFEEGGRSIMQSLCVGLARLGCVVFHYDMLGYADSQQLSLDLVHGFAKQRGEMTSATPGQWGLFSPQAEAHLQSAMGLQTWNSVRALDFLLDLPEVDPARVACTGASGGGTQTFLLAALDDRVRLAFPAVMVSTAMQGGCTCENACLLRVGTGNVEIAGLIAPRPLGMTTADDWTREMATRGFPELQRLYALLGAPDNVALFRGEHFEHNYNAVSRVAFYGWLNRHFGLGLPEPVLERDYVRLTREQLTVWDDAHPAPPAGPAFERQLLFELHEDSRRQLEEAARDPGTFRRVQGTGVEVVIGRTLAEAGEVRWMETGAEEAPWGRKVSGRLVNVTHHEELPVLCCEPRSPGGLTVLWLSDKGREGLFPENRLLPAARRLLDHGARVCSVDFLFLGASEGPDAAPARNRRVANPRESAAYVYGYNRALFSQRVHDVLSVLAYLRRGEPPPRLLAAVALGAATGPILAGALAVAPGAIERVAVDTHGFRFGQVSDLWEAGFLPGGAKYGDLPSMLALGRVPRLWLAGEPEATATEVTRLGETRVTSAGTAPGDAAELAVAWLLES